MNGTGMKLCKGPLCKAKDKHGAMKPLSDFGKHAWCKDCNRGNAKLQLSWSKIRIKGQLFSQDHYDAAMAEQGGACAICGRLAATRTGKRPDLVPDHDHDTAEFRALVCHGCNGMIAAWDDDPAFLELAVAYLTKHSARRGRSLKPIKH